jgi:glycosyltransferase involved in cell wall biosynthesis
MRVLHAPENIAGQASIIAEAQRRLGITSEVLVFQPSLYDFKHDYSLNLESKNFLLKVLRVLIAFISSIFRYDVFHFHYGKSFLPYNVDMLILKTLRKKVFMHFWGSDIIQSDIARQYTLFSPELLKKVYPNLNDIRTRKKIRRINRWVEKSIVGDYSLLPFSPESVVIRQAIELSRLPYYGSMNGEEIVKIIHAPTNRLIKGTDLIVKEIERLKTDGYNIELILVENRKHEEAIELYKEGDIVIDDVLQGPYGILAIECMALGKPVLCRIDPKLKNYYHDLPVVDTPPGQIYENIKFLVIHPEIRVELGLKGRIYVEKNHDSLVVANRLIDLYTTGN